jgi:hypothetical protein
VNESLVFETLETTRFIPKGIVVTTDGLTVNGIDVFLVFYVLVAWLALITLYLIYKELKKK